MTVDQLFYSHYCVGESAKSTFQGASSHLYTRRMIFKTALYSIHRHANKTTSERNSLLQNVLSSGAAGKWVSSRKKSWRNGLELKCCFGPEETLCILFSGAFASLYLSAASLARPAHSVAPRHTLSLKFQLVLRAVTKYRVRVQAPPPLRAAAFWLAVPLSPPPHGRLSF